MVVTTQIVKNGERKKRERKQKKERKKERKKRKTNEEKEHTVSYSTRELRAHVEGIALQARTNKLLPSHNDKAYTIEKNTWSPIRSVDRTKSVRRC